MPTNIGLGTLEDKRERGKLMDIVKRENECEKDGEKTERKKKKEKENLKKTYFVFPTSF